MGSYCCISYNNLPTAIVKENMTGCTLILVQQIIRPLGGNYLGTESSSGVRIQGKKVIERRMM